MNMWLPAYVALGVGIIGLVAALGWRVAGASLQGPYRRTASPIFMSALFALVLAWSMLDAIGAGVLTMLPSAFGLGFSVRWTILSWRSPVVRQ